MKSIGIHRQHIIAHARVKTINTQRVTSGA
jgi:hypothetical protein